jgi:hypothetical protein
MWTDLQLTWVENPTCLFCGLTIIMKSLLECVHFRVDNEFYLCMYLQRNTQECGTNHMAIFRFIESH